MADVRDMADLRDPPPGLGGGAVWLEGYQSGMDFQLLLIFLFSPHVSHTRLTFNKIKAPPPVTRACNKGIDFNEVY